MNEDVRITAEQLRQAARLGAAAEPPEPKEHPAPSELAFARL